MILDDGVNEGCGSWIRRRGPGETRLRKQNVIRRVYVSGCHVALMLSDVEECGRF